MNAPADTWLMIRPPPRSSIESLTAAVQCDGPDHVHAHHPVEQLEGEVEDVDLGDLGHERGVVHEDVDAAEGADGVGGHVGRGRAVGDVDVYPMACRPSPASSAAARGGLRRRRRPARRSRPPRPVPGRTPGRWRPLLRSRWRPCHRARSDRAPSREDVGRVDGLVAGGVALGVERGAERPVRAHGRLRLERGPAAAERRRRLRRGSAPRASP